MIGTSDQLCWVGWQKLVKSRSGGCLERSGDRKPTVSVHWSRDRRDHRKFIPTEICDTYQTYQILLIPRNEYTWLFNIIILPFYGAPRGKHIAYGNIRRY